MYSMAMSTTTRFDYTIKIILLGDHSVGKSSLLTHLAEIQDSRDLSYRCLNYRPNSHVELAMLKNGKKVLVRIVDTGGQERFRSITASFYRGTQGCLLMFDAEKVDSFRHVYTWYTDLETYTNNNPMSTFLVGVNTQSPSKQHLANYILRTAGVESKIFLEVKPTCKLQSSRDKASQDIIIELFKSKKKRV
ncbi:Ras- protein Rab-18-B [Bulinus truncatus]|nr:Ras- protein Rab-18-B [Bulinus truncatus]